MKVAVTGSSSQIGRAVVGALESRGAEVVEMGRRASGGSREFRRFDIARPLDPASVADVSSVVHLAWSWEGDEVLNLRAGRRLIDAAARAGAPVTLLSTFSAFAASTSRYGAAKLALEGEAASRGGSALRSGLIWGGDSLEGMMATLSKIARLPVISMRLAPDPLMFQTRQDDLAAALADSALDSSGPSGTQLAAYRSPVALSEILQTLRRGPSALTIPAPTRLIAATSAVASRLHIPLPFRPDSVQSLLAGAPTIPPDAKWASGFPANEEFLAWANNVGR